MSYGWRQALLVGAGAVLFCGIVGVLAKRRLVSLRYALGWTAIAFIGILGALLTPLIKPVADVLGMSPTGVLLAGATSVLLVIALQLSVSVSGLQSQLREVAEAVALLDSRVRELDDRERAR